MPEDDPGLVTRTVTVEVKTAGSDAGPDADGGGPERGVTLWIHADRNRVETAEYRVPRRRGTAASSTNSRYSRAKMYRPRLVTKNLRVPASFR